MPRKSKKLKVLSDQIKRLQGRYNRLTCKIDSIMAKRNRTEDALRKGRKSFDLEYRKENETRKSKMNLRGTEDPKPCDNYF